MSKKIHYPDAPNYDPAPPVSAGETQAVMDVSPSDKLQQETVGCRLRMQKLGLSRGFDAATIARLWTAVRKGI